MVLNYEQVRYCVVRVKVSDVPGVYYGNARQFHFRLVHEQLRNDDGLCETLRILRQFG